MRWVSPRASATAPPPRHSGICIFQLLELNLHAWLPFHSQASWASVSLPRPQSPNWVRSTLKPGSGPWWVWHTEKLGTWKTLGFILSSVFLLRLWRHRAPFRAEGTPCGVSSARSGPLLPALILQGVHPKTAVSGQLSHRHAMAMLVFLPPPPSILPLCPSSPHPGSQHPPSPLCPIPAPRRHRAGCEASSCLEISVSYGD